MSHSSGEDTGFAGPGRPRATPKVPGHIICAPSGGLILPAERSPAAYSCEYAKRHRGKTGLWSRQGSRTPGELQVGGERTLASLATPAGIVFALRVPKMLGGAFSFHRP